MSDDYKHQVIKGLQKLAKETPVAFMECMCKSVDMLDHANFDLEDVGMAMLSTALRTDDEATLAYIRIHAPMVALLHSAALYASQLEDPSSFTWKTFFESLGLKV